MNTDTSRPHNSHWYALRTHLNQENRVEANLRAWNVETFYPRIREYRRNQFSGALSSLTKPFFPQYLFARFDSEQVLHKVWFTRGVQYVVSFSGTPCPVDSEIIEFLQARVDDNNFVRVGEELKPGDKVGLKGGVLDSLVGIFEREMNDAERVMVLLEAIDFQGHIIVERSSLRKIAR